ncbi:hypothetical protein Tco_0885469 [Tanacetum coccineum]
MSGGDDDGDCGVMVVVGYEGGGGAWPGRSGWGGRVFGLRPENTSREKLLVGGGWSGGWRWQAAGVAPSGGGEAVGMPELR